MEAGTRWHGESTVSASGPGSLETGRLYLYTLALFVAVLLGAGSWLLRAL